MIIYIQLCSVAQIFLILVTAYQEGSKYTVQEKIDFECVLFSSQLLFYNINFLMLSGQLFYL